MPWRVYQVNEVWLRGLLFASLVLITRLLKVERHASRLDSNAAVDLFLETVREAGITSIFTGDDAGFCDERVRQGGLSVVDVRNHRHVSDLLSVVHDLADLVECEVWHVLVLFLRARLLAFSD